MRGKNSENLAVQLLEKNGATILYRNCRFPFGEVDILSRKDDALYLIEVKTVNSFLAIDTRVSRRQKRALRYNRMWLQEEFALPAKILWAFVSMDKIVWIRDEGY